MHNYFAHDGSRDMFTDHQHGQDMPPHLLNSVLDRSYGARAPPSQPFGKRPNRPRKSSVTENARKGKHERERSKDHKRFSHDRKALSAEPYNKKWEDLLDAAQSATEEESRDLTPVSGLDKCWEIASRAFLPHVALAVPDPLSCYRFLNRLDLRCPLSRGKAKARTNSNRTTPHHYRIPYYHRTRLKTQILNSTKRVRKHFRPSNLLTTPALSNLICLTTTNLRANLPTRTLACILRILRIVIMPRQQALPFTCRLMA